jgi:CubicO group peptidase (beta-lactamase class C family)
MFPQIPRRSRRTTRQFSLLLAALLVIISCAFAIAQDNALSSEKRAQVEKAISAFMTANGVPGVSVAVVQNGKPVWSAGFGMSDLEDFARAASSTSTLRSKNIVPPSP